METLQRLTNSINVFVRFFESINCLFWQLSWLQQNIRGSNLITLGIVAVIVLFCILLLVPEGEISAFADGVDRALQLPPSTTLQIVRLLPIVIVVAVIAFYLYRRINPPKYVGVRDTDFDDVERKDPSDDRNMRIPSAPFFRSF